jgi:hypothetical protein
MRSWLKIKVYHKAYEQMGTDLYRYRPNFRLVMAKISLDKERKVLNMKICFDIC